MPGQLYSTVLHRPYIYIYTYASVAIFCLLLLLLLISSCVLLATSAVELNSLRRHTTVVYIYIPI